MNVQRWRRITVLPHWSLLSAQSDIFLASNTVLLYSSCDSLLFSDSEKDGVFVLAVLRRLFIVSWTF